MQNFEPEFDFTYTIDKDGNIGASDEYTPFVSNHPDMGEDVEGDWELLAGHSGQYGYNGAVMHPSEQWGEWAIADLKNLADVEGETLHFSVVEVRDEDGNYPDGDSIGWAVAYKYTKK